MTSQGEVPGLDRFGRFTSRVELAALRPKLLQGEVVRYALAATGDKPGLLAATDRRILWLSQGSLQVRAASYLYGEIKQVLVEVGRDGATITLVCPDGRHTFSGADRRLARVFADQVRTVPRLADFRRVELLDHEPEEEPENLPPPREPYSSDVRERLARLERMKAKGSITEPEYNANRRRILENAQAVADEDRVTPSHLRPFAKKVEF